MAPRGWRQSWQLSGAWCIQKEWTQARGEVKRPRLCGGEGRCLREGRLTREKQCDRCGTEALQGREQAPITYSCLFKHPAWGQPQKYRQEPVFCTSHPITLAPRPRTQSHTVKCEELRLERPPLAGMQTKPRFIMLSLRGKHVPNFKN